MSHDRNVTSSIDSEDLQGSAPSEEGATKAVHNPSFNFEPLATYDTEASTSIDSSQSGPGTKFSHSPLGDFLQRRTAAISSVDVSTGDLGDYDAWLDDDDDSDHTTNTPHISPETNRDALQAIEERQRILREQAKESSRT